MLCLSADPLPRQPSIASFNITFAIALPNALHNMFSSSRRNLVKKNEMGGEALLSLNVDRYTYVHTYT